MQKVIFGGLFGCWLGIIQTRPLSKPDSCVGILILATEKPSVEAPTSQGVCRPDSSLSNCSLRPLVSSIMMVASPSFLAWAYILMSRIEISHERTIPGWSCCASSKVLLKGSWGVVNCDLTRRVHVEGSPPNNQPTSLKALMASCSGVVSGFSGIA